MFVLGELGRHYFEQQGVHIDKQFHYTVQNPSLNRARNISGELLEQYHEGKLDEIYIIYTAMVNAVAEEVEIKQLLPLKRADFTSLHIPVDAPREELALVPSAEAVMDRIVPDYLVGFVYGAPVSYTHLLQIFQMLSARFHSSVNR